MGAGVDGLHVRDEPRQRSIFPDVLGGIDEQAVVTGLADVAGAQLQREVPGRDRLTLGLPFQLLQGLGQVPEQLCRAWPGSGTRTSVGAAQGPLPRLGKCRATAWNPELGCEAIR
jgi:hypothetical protein